MSNRVSLILLAGLLAAAAGMIPAAAAEHNSSDLPPSLETLLVDPATVHLQGSHRKQQLLITAVDRSGRNWDVTDRCTVQVADTTVAVAERSLIRAVADGETTVTVRCGKLQARLAVRVKDVASYPPVDFRNDLIPLFGKGRCNGSGCHGKQAGQNGFKLSVFGFDPAADYDALVKEGRGRRVFPAAPDRSLLIQKATGQVSHGGGRRIEPDSEDAQLLRQWIVQGAPWSQANAPTLSGIRVTPQERVVGFQGVQRILVTAVYSDGTMRDVTEGAAYVSNAASVAQVDEVGRIRTGKTPGEAAITVRYMNQVDVVRVMIPRPDRGDDILPLPVNNRIDRLVWKKLEKMRIRPSGASDDATFLRRLYLDAIGTLPRPDEVQAFLADNSDDKRQRAIERVLEREEFADYWALQWSDVLLVNSESLGNRGAFALHRWLQTQVRDNRPYNQWVAELLTASGSSGKNGPVNFYRALRTPQDLTKAVSQAFLGIRLDCAQCHQHPFEKWGQRDFYGMAGFFNGLQRKSLGTDRELVFHSGHKPARLPLINEEIPTRPLDGEPLQIEPGADPRVPLSRWLTAADNPWFARLVANRMWKHYLGRGLVEPEDDLRSTNPAVNEPLLEFLSEQLVASQFDLKALMRLILNSRVYQLASETNETNGLDEQNFSHHLVKRLPAEVLLDAISEVTGSPEDFVGAPRGTRSIELWDNRLPSYFLDIFGRSARESPCACGKSGEPTMAQALHLMNAPEIEAKIADPRGRVARLVASRADRDRIVQELCLAALGRPPGNRERAIADKLFAARPRQQAAEDFLWTLLNSYEFLFID